MNKLIELERKVDDINRKLGLIHQDILTKVDKRKYLTAKQVGDLTGLDHRTILNRTCLPQNDRRFIPFVTFGPRRKLFERVVIERMFRV